ncbi:hypothetical protein MIMGU_mgv1a026414mg, partial [Erythranthe guttata]
LNTIKHSLSKSRKNPQISRAFQITNKSPIKPKSEERIGIKMVRANVSLLRSAGAGISTTLAEILVCPLSKQPLRLCEKTNSLISDSIGVSFPIVDGIPRLAPADGTILDADDNSDSGGVEDSQDKDSSEKK